MYGFWETNNICKITVDNYSTKVDMAVKDADQNVITDTYATKTAVTQEIKDAISGNMAKDKLRNLVYTSNVITLLEDGLEKVVEGYTTFEELLKIIEFDDVTGKYK